MTLGKILVVDDSPTDLALMVGPLRNEGFEVVIATDGEEALRKVEEVNPRCIVLDVVMPRKNGFQVCRTLKNGNFRDIPIILLTSKSERTDELWGMRQGADVYLTKPFAVPDLVSHVRRLV